MTCSDSERESGRRPAASVPGTCPLATGSAPPGPHVQCPALEAPPFLEVPTLRPVLPDGGGLAPVLTQDAGLASV